MVETLKALLLIPFAFAGAFTVPALRIPPGPVSDVLLPIALLSPVYLGFIALLGWMWRQPSDRRYLGHSRRTWSFLMSVAYFAGAVCMLLP